MFRFKMGYCPDNRNWDYGKKATVLAKTSAEAYTKLREVLGDPATRYRQDYKVTIYSFEEVEVTEDEKFREWEKAMKADNPDPQYAAND